MTTLERQPELARGYGDSRTRATRPTRARGEIADQNSLMPTAWRQRIPGPQLPGFVSGVTLFVGLWLLLAPAAWNYGDTGGGFDARWNDIVVGAVIAAVGVARLTGMVRLGLATLVAVAAGAWLIVAPFALAYGLGADSTRATLNDLVLGLLIIPVSVIGHIGARMAIATRI